MTRTTALLRVALLAALALAAVSMWWVREGPASPIDAAYETQQSGLIVVAEGQVHRILADDLDGSAHQRFIIRMPSGLTLLVAHNIDLAPRIPDLQVGKSVTVRGQYEWNEKGGLVHWTHHDPRGYRDGGWVEYQGRTYR
jgi:hypothetical protein